LAIVEQSKLHLGIGRKSKIAAAAAIAPGKGMVEELRPK